MGLPEYYNSISSLFIVYFGLYGLYQQHNDLFIDILYASLAIVGIGSTGYHWYGNIGWALFDEMPMIITVFSGILYTDNVYYLTYNNKYIKENSDDNFLVESKQNRIIQNNASSGLQQKCNIFFYLLGMYIFMIRNVMSEYRMIFPELFTCVVAGLYYKIYKLVNLLEPHFKSQVASKARNSCIIISTSGLIWALTEVSCNYVDYKILLLGHPMWHFFIGHGFYNMIHVIYFIKLHNSNLHLKYNSYCLLQISSDTQMRARTRTCSEGY